MSSSKQILVVEDDWLIAADHSETLRFAGYHVLRPASSVSAALEMIDALPIDAAILDLNLNGMASYPVAEFLILKGIPFIFVSGYTREDLKPDYKDVPLLSKPVGDDLLLSAVRKLIKNP